MFKSITDTDFQTLLSKMKRHQQEDILLFLAHMIRYLYKVLPPKKIAKRQSIQRSNGSYYIFMSKGLYEYLEKSKGNGIFTIKNIDNDRQGWIKIVVLPLLINICLSIKPEEYKGNEKFIQKHYFELEKIIENLYHKYGDKNNDDDILTYIVRLAFVQIPEQEIFFKAMYHIVRSYNIYKLMNIESLAIDGSEFREIIKGLPHSIFVLAALAVLPKNDIKYFIPEKYYTETPLVKDLQLLDSFSKSFEEFNNEMKNLRNRIYKDKEFTLYDIFQEPNLLHLYPMIRCKNRSSEDVYLLVNPGYLMRAISDGIYFQIMNRFNRFSGVDEKKRQCINELSKRFGESFEKYIECNVLHHLIDKDGLRFHLFKENDLKKEDDKFKVVDFILVNSSKDKVLLIEAKTARMNVKNRCLLDRETLKEYITGDLKKGINQLAVCKNNIIEGKYNVLEKFELTNAKFYKILVIYEKIWHPLLHDPSTKKIIKLLKSSNNQLNNEYDNTILMNIAELEHIINLSILAGVDIFVLLDDLENSLRRPLPGNNISGRKDVDVDVVFQNNFTHLLADMKRIGGEFAEMFFNQAPDNIKEHLAQYYNINPED